MHCIPKHGHCIVKQLACTTTYQNRRTIPPVEFFQNRARARKKKKKILLSVSYRILKFLDARNLWMSQAQLLLEQTVAKDSIDGISAISLVHLFQCCTDLVNTFFSNI